MPRTRLRNGDVPGGQREGVRPPGRAWVCGRSTGRSDSCASREPPSLVWPDNSAPRGTPCGPISSRVCKPHLMTPLVSQACGCWGLTRGVWHHQDRRRRGPRELTGIVDLTCGKDHPTAHSLDLVPGRSGTVYKNWLEERGEDFRSGIQIAILDPLPGTARTPSPINSKTPPASSTPFTSSSSLATPLMRCAAASSKTPWVTADARAIPSTKSAISCAPHTRRLTPRQQERLRETFTADEAHISVEVAYQPTGQVCDALHEDTPNTLLASIDTATNSVQSRYVKDCGALATPKSERSLGVSYTVTSESLYAIALPLPA